MANGRSRSDAKVRLNSCAISNADARTPSPVAAIARDWRLAVPVLILLCAAFFLPGLSSIPPIDRDEARFAQATRQMVASGDYLLPRFGNDYRLNKPIGIYWLQSASLRAFGQSNPADIWPYRLPSVLGALAAVLFTFRIGKVLFDDYIALVASVLLSCSALLVIEAHQATTDAMLLACTTGEMACFAGIYLDPSGTGRSPRYAIAGFWIWLGAGILIKGPVLPGLTVLTASLIAISDRTAIPSGRERPRRWLRMLQPQWGIPLTATIVVPWILAIGTTGDLLLFRQSILKDFLPRFVGACESHGGPPGYYLFTSIAAFWPGSLLLAPAMLFAVRRRSRPEYRFCLGWLVPAWIVLELVPTKLPHYALPLYPPIALITAAAVADYRAKWRMMIRTPLAIGWAGMWAVVTIGIGALALLLTGRPTAACFLCAAIGVSAAALGAWYVRRAMLERALAAGAAAALVIYFVLLQWQLPSAQWLWPSHGIRRQMAAVARGESRPVAAIGYQEPSLAFSLEQPPLFADPLSAADFLAGHPEGIVLSDAVQKAAFVQAAADRKIPLRIVWSWEGFNYSKNQHVRLEMFERDDMTDGAQRPEAMSRAPSPLSLSSGPMSSADDSRAHPGISSRIASAARRMAP